MPSMPPQLLLIKSISKEPIPLLRFAGENGGQEITCNKYSSFQGTDIKNKQSAPTKNISGSFNQIGLVQFLRKTVMVAKSQ